MPDREEDFEAFRKRLRQLKVSGEVARRQIADRLARMTLEELRRVPPWVIVRLGPSGIAMVAERSAVLRVKTGGSPRPVLAPSPTITKPKPKPSWIATLRRRRPLWWECINKIAVAAAIGLIVVEAFPFATRAIPMLAAPAGAQGQCGRLDRWSGDCVYITGSSNLTLATASQYLRLPPSELAAVNPSLELNRLLPRGTPIRVPRRSGLNLW
jgi:hypothetical protein